MFRESVKASGTPAPIDGDGDNFVGEKTSFYFQFFNLAFERVDLLPVDLALKSQIFKGFVCVLFNLPLNLVVFFPGPFDLISPFFLLNVNHRKPTTFELTSRCLIKF